MRMIGTTAGVVGIVLLVTAMSASWLKVGASPAIDQEVLIAREAAWRAYFAGDVKVLGDLLPADFIGIGMTDAPFADRARTLDDARVSSGRGPAGSAGVSGNAGPALRRCRRALRPVRSGDPVRREGANAAGPPHRDVRPAQREMAASGLAPGPDGRTGCRTALSRATPAVEDSPAVLQVTR